MIEPTLEAGDRRIAGHDVAEALAALQRIEGSLEALSSRKPRENGFGIVGDWLIRDDLLRKRLRRSDVSKPAESAAVAIPGLPVRARVSALRHLLFSDRVRLRTSASAIFFRSNLRAFYPERPPLTLWIAGQQQTSEQLVRAMALRARFGSWQGLRSARVIAHEAQGDPPYLLEEMVIGRCFGKPGDWAALAEGLLPPLFSFYDQDGIRHVRASKYYETESIRAQLASTIQEFAWKRTWIDRERFVEASHRCLLLGEETLPLCTGHGDLTKTNLLVSAESGIALLDWEHAREMPIAAEWVKLVRQHPPLAEQLAPELERRTEDPIAMTPARQLLLATLDRIAGLAHSTLDASGGGGPHALRARRARKAGFWIPLASHLIEASG